MESNIEYSVLGPYLYKKYTGDVTYKTILDSWDYMLNNNIITNDIKGIIGDFRECKFVYDIEDVEKLIEGLMKYKSTIYNLLLTQLVNIPKIIIMTIFYMQSTNYMSKPFLSLEECIKWMDKRLSKSL